MKTLYHNLKHRLESLEAEQNRLNGILDEVSEVKAKIERLKTTLAQSGGENQVQTTSVLSHNEETNHNQPSATQMSPNVSTNQGYVVCLMFNSHSPPEWSGTQWHPHGKGKCYPTPEQAHQCLQKLQQLWPGYPFQILKR